MINGDYALARATALAQRLAKTDFATADQMLIWAFRSTWGRGPSEEERDQSLRFLGGSPDVAPSSIDAEKLIDFCHVLFNSSEFLYVD
jgi:hypothetical protein